MNNSEQAPPTSVHSVLCATDLHKSYRMGSGTLDVLRGVDIDLHAGEVTALMGSSGSGKSTLLQLLGLMDSVDQGKIFLRGRAIHKLRAGAMAKVRAQELGFVFQQFQLIQELSALENVLLPRRIARGFTWFANRHTERRRATAVLEEVGLGTRIRHRPNQLSGGEQQRVAIARALVSAPPVLLADEPTGNLDRQTGADILDLLLKLARERGSAMLLATHDERIANACDRIIHLRDGRLA